MATLSLTRLAVAAGSLALSFTAAAGTASAAPDLGPIVNTTCTYPQVMAALNAQDPAAAADLRQSPGAQFFLRSFLNSPPDQRQQQALKVQGMPEAQQYIPTIVSVAGSCNNY